MRRLKKNLHMKSTRGEAERLPPGPWKLPILGSIHHLIGGSKLPHHRFQELSKVYGPLMHLRLGEVSMLIVSSPEVAKELMKTHDTNFATRPLFPAMDIFSYRGKSMSFGPYGENWRQLRKICVLELLSSRKSHPIYFLEIYTWFYHKSK
ncbi:uncharacterized protein A4U43_C05F19200 [Asparagus officinalis]|uniref:Cytochrome P450 n=1 Tax=Asparagus officinalis TaxID=4686 RepID=A0A5P1ESW9_ASPOF|nr:uncharacterized protein A4U43_C05F19200 [Asparagus officinalis]